MLPLSSSSKALDHAENHHSAKRQKKEIAAEAPLAQVGDSFQRIGQPMQEPVALLSDGKRVLDSEKARKTRRKVENVAKSFSEQNEAFSSVFSLGKTQAITKENFRGVDYISFMEKQTSGPFLVEDSFIRFLQENPEINWSCSLPVSIDLRGKKLEDYSFLSRFSQIASLNLSDTAISDLLFLQGCEVVELDLSRTSISDLSLLPSFNLQRLSLCGSSFIDKASLAACTTLRKLNLSKTAVNDLCLFSNLTQLEELNLSECPLSEEDMAPLSACQKLQKFDLSYAGVRNLDALFEAPLMELNLCGNESFTSIASLLKFTRLQKLNLSGTEIQNDDLLQLVSFSSLQELNLSFISSITDLSPLKACPFLKVLDLSGIKDVDISFISKLSYIRELKLSYCSGIDFLLLTTCKRLQKLNLLGTSVLDASFLSQLHFLEDLNLSYSSYIHLPFLRDCRLLKTLTLHSPEDALSSTPFFTIKLKDGKELHLSPSVFHLLEQSEYIQLTLSSEQVLYFPLYSLEEAIYALSILEHKTITRENYLGTDFIHFLSLETAAFIELEEKDAANFFVDRSFLQVLQENPELHWNCLLPVSIELEGEAVKSLSSLSHFPQIRKLTLTRVRGVDLSPLQNCQILELNLHDIEVRHLNFLGHMTYLKRLTINSFHYREFTDISALEGCTSLEEIDFQGLSIENLLAFSTLTNLKKVRIADASQLTDISALSNCIALEEVALRGVRMQNLLAFSTLQNLKKLKISTTRQLTDISDLRNCVSLEEIDIQGASIKSLAAFSTLNNLKKCRFFGTRELIDISGLGSCTSLEEVDLQEVIIPNLLAFSTLNKLKKASILRSRDLVDISGLRGCVALEELNLNWAPIRSFPNLSSLKRLKKVNIFNCRELVDISGLTSCLALEEIALARTQISNFSIFSELKNLKKITGEFLETTEVLGLINCAALEEISFYRAEISDLSPLKNLRVLSLFSCRMLPDISWLSRCVSIEKICIEESILPQVQRMHHFPDLSALIHLRSLSLLDCSALADISGIRNSVSLNDLTLTRGAVRHLPDFSPLENLKKANFSNCLELADISGLRNCTALEEICLHAAKIRNLSDFINFKRLKKADFSNCRELVNISDLSGCTALEELDIHLVSVKGFPDFSPFTSLKKITLSSRKSKRNDSGLAALKENIPDIEIITH